MQGAGKLNFMVIKKIQQFQWYCTDVGEKLKNSVFFKIINNVFR